MHLVHPASSVLSCYSVHLSGHHAPIFRGLFDLTEAMVLKWEDKRAWISVDVLFDCVGSVLKSESLSVRALALICCLAL